MVNGNGQQWIFRVNYATRFGQSLWLGVRVASGEWDWQAMHWLNDRQWQVTVGGIGDMAAQVVYRYQLRDDLGEVEDEWGGDRSLEIGEGGVLLMIDDWRSAETEDYFYVTKAFDRVFPERVVEKLPMRSGWQNHGFRLMMAGVPSGMVPCVIGSVSELGDWQWDRAIPLVYRGGHQWAVDGYVPSDWHVEYKYGLYDVELGKMVEIEGGVNRVLQARWMGEGQWTRVSDERYRRGDHLRYRGVGVAIPVFSLRSEQGLGVGEFEDLKRFGEWVSRIGGSMVQILPINDTTKLAGWKDSYPYSAISVDALHPLYLNLEGMTVPLTDGELADVVGARQELNGGEGVQYQRVMDVKMRVLRRVYARVKDEVLQREEFVGFVSEQSTWLRDYAWFCVLRDQFGSADFRGWGEWAEYDSKKLEEAMVGEKGEECGFYQWLQYELDQQLMGVVAYLHGIGICLKGDLPIGVDAHSVDAWARPHLFHLDAQAGAPPDAFAKKGQNWGFPTYHWQVMKEDGYAWWRKRFERLSRYFDAYRIDHILGFFRIWQVPHEHVEGLMGWFDPALAIERAELDGLGIGFEEGRYCDPYLTDEGLDKRFGTMAPWVREHYVRREVGGRYGLAERVSGQKKVLEEVATLAKEGRFGERELAVLREGLMECVSEVIFLRERKDGSIGYHPRFGVRETDSYQALGEAEKRVVGELHDDYFYRRQESFWRKQGMDKLPTMRKASRMLLCGEDLGMVPQCVPEVMKRLGMLSLEIERMPKSSEHEFVDLKQVPYASVVSSSTHDMNPLRGWWMEDSGVTSRYAWKKLGIAFAPRELDCVTASAIVAKHLQSPAMWVVFPVQDLFACDVRLVQKDPEFERINQPAVMPFEWKYRMHVTIESLLNAEESIQWYRQLMKR